MLFVTVPVSFQPVIHITSNEYENRENQQSARVVNFVKGNVKMEANNLIQYLYVFTSFFFNKFRPFI